MTYNQINMSEITNIATMEKFSNKLKKSLNEKGLTQGQLSNKTGIKRSTIANYVNDRSNPSLKRFLIICKVLDIKELN